MTVMIEQRVKTATEIRSAAVSALEKTKGDKDTNAHIANIAPHLVSVDVQTRQAIVTEIERMVVGTFFSTLSNETQNFIALREAVDQFIAKSGMPITEEDQKVSTAKDAYNFRNTVSTVAASTVYMLTQLALMKGWGAPGGFAPDLAHIDAVLRRVVDVEKTCPTLGEFSSEEVREQFPGATYHDGSFDVKKKNKTTRH